VRIVQELRTFGARDHELCSWLAGNMQLERAECSRSPIVQRYLHGPGTGITNLPSFSATKFSELLDELPLASLFSTLMTSFFVGLRFRQTLPVGPSIGVIAFLTSSGVTLTSSIVEIFSPAPPRLHHFVKLEGPGGRSLCVKEASKVAVSLPSIAALFLSLNAFSCSGVPATIPGATENGSAPATVKIFVEVFMAATVGGSISATQANSKKKIFLCRSL
jgi:hypothetical protein